MIFSQKILLWYAKNKRTLPWRRTKDPYRIWLSEIMLQQTRVAQGLPYYLKFIEQFPTINDLAGASEESVLKLWQGLGYYSRARNLHATAKTVVSDYDGKFPQTYNELLKLKGVGDYTASAIASICFDEPEPVVDGNVYRVLARFHGAEFPINNAKGIAFFKELAREHMDTENVRDYNQGIMEFGAMQCVPKNPDCSICPLNDSCLALQKNKIGELPVKLNKTKIIKRFFNYLVLLDSNHKTLLRQRKGKGIWQNLWEFPLLETSKKIDQSELEDSINDVIAVKGPYETYLYNQEDIIHKLSHQHLYTKFWVLRTESVLKDGIDYETLNSFPVPVLIADFIKTFKI
ncbi:MAG: A/G-specific adenine glycosylase [Maribacter sp.]|nr:A/G-specific adenine glycosylase [Maribacter sp.]